MAGTKSSGRPSVKNQLEVKGDQSPPEMPDDMSEIAKEVWQLAVESLPHVLRPVDGPILRLACESYASAVELFAAGESKQAVAAARGYEQLASKLGLHPSARRVVRPVEESKSDDDSDIVAKLLRRGGLN